MEGRHTLEKVCLITGATKGIGKALLKRFKEEGFYVVNVSRTESSQADLNLTADLTDPDSRRGIIDRVLQTTGRLDVLINNAGVGMYEPWESTEESELRKMFELNLFAPIELSRQAIPYLKRSKGCIINVSSVAGKVSIPFMGGYCATKHALNAFSDSLRAELRPYGIHVLNLIVGRINTGFSERAFGSKKPPSTPLSGSADKLAKLTYEAYIKGKREITYPLWYKLYILLAKLAPGLHDRIALRSWK
jgi:short-subunit dehydrogenase